MPNVPSRSSGSGNPYGWGWLAVSLERSRLHLNLPAKEENKAFWVLRHREGWEIVREGRRERLGPGAGGTENGRLRGGGFSCRLGEP